MTEIGLGLILFLPSLQTGFVLSQMNVEYYQQIFMHLLIGTCGFSPFN